MKKETYAPYEDEVYSLGMSLGFLGLGFQGVFYYENPELISGLILANIFSGIYELRKNNNKKLEDKISQ